MSAELLLPAGSYENFVVAVNNGADAVYLGGSRFSARANAVNFTDEEIISAVKYAHVRGVKVYVAVNTLIEDDRLADALEFARFCYVNGVDALIVQDTGLLRLLRQYLSDMKLNASTQMTIHNLKGVKAAENSGFSRVVLSRELSRGEIAGICAQSDAEIEVFAHGALCMCYSGQCLMSSFIGGRSGNRGACAQPCRLPYGLKDCEGNVICSGKYLLSLKDLCMLDKVEDLEEIGVNSLKIEGRMKNKAYVALTADTYSRCISGGEMTTEDIEDLQSVFSRNGFTQGYYKNSTGKAMLNFDSSNDDVYKNISKRAEERANALCRENNRKVLVFAAFTAASGKRAELTIWDNEGNLVTAYSDALAETALKVSLTEERVISQLSKTGGTPFALDGVTVSIGEGISIPVSSINEMRRNAFEALETKRRRDNPKAEFPEYKLNIIRRSGEVSFTAAAMTYEQIKVIEKKDVSRIYISKSLYDEHREEFSSDRFFVILPAIERFGNEAKGYDRICTSNFSQIKDAAVLKHGGAMMNVFNSEAVRFFADNGYSSVCLSPELNMKQIKSISKDIPLESVVYGYLPVMTVQNCVIKSACGKCSCDRGVYTLIDRKGAGFNVVADKTNCTNTIFNSAPLYMGDRMSDLRHSGITYASLFFTFESEEEVDAIFDLYIKGKPFNKPFTRGHFYRGV